MFFEELHVSPGSLKKQVSFLMFAFKLFDYNIAQNIWSIILNDSLKHFLKSSICENRGSVYLT